MKRFFLAVLLGMGVIGLSMSHIACGNKKSNNNKQEKAANQDGGGGGGESTAKDGGSKE